jgi:hypothetical protein
MVESKPAILAPAIDTERALKLWRKAGDTFLRRMARDEKMRYVLGGSETYAQILDAYEASVPGCILPAMPELAPVNVLWDALHPRTEGEG